MCDQPYISLAQVAEILKLSKQTVLDRIKKLGEEGAPFFYQDKQRRWFIKNPGGIGKLREKRQRAKPKRLFSFRLNEEESKNFENSMQEQGHKKVSAFVNYILRKNNII